MQNKMEGEKKILLAKVQSNQGRKLDLLGNMMEFKKNDERKNKANFIRRPLII